MKAQPSCKKAARERIEKIYTKSGSNIMKMSTLALITAMVSIEVQIVYDLLLHKPHTQSLPNLMLVSRNSYKMNEYIRNVSRQDKEYNVPMLTNEEQDPRWYTNVPQYP